ncbi:MAG: peptidase, partial [Clostridiales bacterium]
VRNSRGITGGEMAELILRNAGIRDVSVVCIGGQLSDHFDPVKKVVRLSEQVYYGSSIASIGVAAHECGHAIQYQEEYVPIRIRSAIIGVTNFSSKLLYILMFASIFFYSQSFSAVVFNVAIICYTILFIFQLVTLPVEFNASARAVKQIEASGFGEEDVRGVKKVLSAAAMTYVASAITVLWQLLLLISRAKNRK